LAVVTPRDHHLHSIASARTTTTAAVVVEALAAGKGRRVTGRVFDTRRFHQGNGDVGMCRLAVGAAEGTAGVQGGREAGEIGEEPFGSTLRAPEPG